MPVGTCARQTAAEKWCSRAAGHRCARAALTDRIPVFVPRQESERRQPRPSGGGSKTLLQAPDAQRSGYKEPRWLRKTYQRLGGRGAEVELPA